jgi:hypothetical protein
LSPREGCRSATSIDNHRRDSRVLPMRTCDKQVPNSISLLFRHFDARAVEQTCASSDRLFQEHRLEPNAVDVPARSVPVSDEVVAVHLTVAAP